MITRSKANTSKPKTYTDGIVQYPLPHAFLVEFDCFLTEPTCYTSAMKHKKWWDSMNLEFDALLKNRTWTLVPPPLAANVIGCKWLFHIKHRADGTVFFAKHS